MSAYRSLRRTHETVAPGARLGRYELLAALGSGGMASVWLGRATRHGRFERLVAIKIVHPELSADARARDMFLREAEIAATIHHANVIDVFDVGECGGVLFQVMTVIEGSDLRHLTDRSRGPLPAGILIAIVSDALRGLHAAHEAPDPSGVPQGLVHRDVSPQNILVGLDGVARISDFGIARVLTTEEEATRSLRGKFSYFSPEQAVGGPLDRRTDVFAMGIILWECLTGARLFRGHDVFESLEMVKSALVEHPSIVRPDCPRELGAVAMRALERAPAERFATAADMAGALAEAARAEGIRCSTDDVARHVEGLVGKEVRERTRRALARTGALEEGPRNDLVASDVTASYVTGTVVEQADHEAAGGASRPNEPDLTLVDERSPGPAPTAGRASRSRALLWVPIALAVVAVVALALRNEARGGPQAAMSSAPAPSVSMSPASVAPTASSASIAPTASSAPPPAAHEGARRRVEKKAPAPSLSRDPPYTDNPFKR